MTQPRPNLTLMLCVAFVCCARVTFGQVIESVGSRALGMGGAFVAVASDSSATWWNPAGLAAGQFVDAAVAHATSDLPDHSSARRDHASWFSLGTPPIGISYYRLGVANVRSFDNTVLATGNPVALQRYPPVRSWVGSQFGITLVQSLVSGVHAGATVKYIRGTLRASPGLGSGSPAVLLSRAEELEGGKGENHVDVDLGLLATAGAMRIGAVVRNLHQTTFGNGQFELARQVRVGAAFNAEELGGTPFILALDADVRRYASASGDRRVVAVGAERWLRSRRFGFRGGGRVNTVGARERSATAGVSMAVRSGMYLDGHIVHGGATDDRGWGIAARVSF